MFIIILLVITNSSIINALYQDYKEYEYKIVNIWETLCTNYNDFDIPTILVPWILASWYKEQWYSENKIKEWEIDPITNSYTPFINLFKDNWYSIKKVIYKDENTLNIDWNPKHSLFLFWYDWKRDNRISASLLTKLINKIEESYKKENWCSIWKINIVSHSMWWLITRAMLEDMCVSDKDLEDNKSNKYIADWVIKNFVNQKCNIKLLINKFISISTPHRWSPKSILLWEKWDFSLSEDLVGAFILKTQLNRFTNLDIYKLIHWYDEQVKNWIITIWQLLPDIKDNISKSFSYLNYINGIYLLSNHPKNKFLENLNKKSNIDKIWGKITNSYISYYTNITWNTWKNNIVSFLLEENKDKKEFSSLDIYEKYSKDINKDFYNIKEANRNQSWLWWDGVVPSLNLLLISNDDNKIIQNKKFKSIELKCYDDKKLSIYWYSDLKKISNNKYESYFKDNSQALTACSHWNTPTSLAKTIYKDLSWIDPKYDIKVNETSYYDSIKNLVRYDILSPVDLQIIDDKWRKIWINPKDWTIINEIPWAWTSWNPGHNIMWEYFLVPKSSSWKINHKIKTFSTWTGQYNIILSDNWKQIFNIKGQAELWLWDQYIVTNNTKWFRKVDDDKNIYIEYIDNDFIFLNRKVDLNYFIRWKNNHKIYKIKYYLKYKDTLIESISSETLWNIKLNLNNIWEYNLKIELYNKGNNIMFTDNLKLNRKINDNLIVYSWDKKNLILNNNSNIKYHKWFDDILYIFTDNKLYKIDLLNKKKTLIFKTNEWIQNLFVDKSGKIYLYDWRFIKYFDSIKKKFVVLLKLDWIKSFVIIDKSIYYIIYNKKWYFEYSLSDKISFNFLEDSKIEYLYVYNNELLFYNNEDIKFVDLYPWFKELYSSSITIIKRRISELSDTKKQKLLNIIISKQDFIISNFSSSYKKELYKFIFWEIIDFLSKKEK